MTLQTQESAVPHSPPKREGLGADGASITKSVLPLGWYDGSLPDGQIAERVARVLGSRPETPEDGVDNVELLLVILRPRNVNPFGISDRQDEILSLMSKGKSNAQIARHLQIAVQTVKFHITVIYQKFGTSDRAEVIRRFLQASA